MYECMDGCMRMHAHMHVRYVQCIYAYMLTYVCVGIQTEITNLIESDRVEHKAEIHTHYG